MITVLTIVGARPQFIKCAPVSRELNRSGIREIVVHTGQHFDAGMSDIFFDELRLTPPDHHLGVGGGGHGEMTGKMLQLLEPLLEQTRPDYVLVYGDTNSTLAGALAASKLHIPVAHVEAGLRSFNRRMPEEQNRVITDHIADWLFTPTRTASRNLLHEGIDEARIHEVGDVMFDAALLFRGKAQAKSHVLERCGVRGRRYVLSTVHRAENTDSRERLRAILEGLDAVAESLPVVLPLHPRTRAAIEREDLPTGGIKIVDPVGYLDMMALECQAALIATDSGGVQKEAYFHGVPCVTLRDETEWLELVELGWNRLASPSTSRIADEILGALGTEGRCGTLFGSGDAAKAIVRTLSESLAVV
jgi:UDP-GlcNAc3NAcA epimerase